MKRWRVNVAFPDLPSAKAEQGREVQAGSLRVAVNRALKEMGSARTLRRLRIRSARITVVYLGKVAKLQEVPPEVKAEVDKLIDEHVARRIGGAAPRLE
jgi:hypothetical protein